MPGSFPCQVLFRAQSLIGGKEFVLELPLRQISSVESTRVHIGNPAIRIRSGRESHVFASFGHLGGVGPRLIDQLTAPLRGWAGSSRDAVLEEIRGQWSPPGGAEPAKAQNPWRCFACCFPHEAVESGGKHSDVTDASPLAHTSATASDPVSPRETNRCAAQWKPRRSPATPHL